METLNGLKRTHYCGDLRESNINEEVVLMGWVQKKRNLGGLVFVDLRDRSGLCQIIFDTDVNAEAFAKAEKLGAEYVVAVKGKVAERSSKNPNMPTGDIEVFATELKVLNKSETPPIYIKDDDNVSEELRLCDTDKKFSKNEVFIVDDVYEEIEDRYGTLPKRD